MQKLRFLAGLVIVVALLAGGCAGAQGEGVRGTSASYWPLDSLALTYADPIAVAAIHDHPLRWFAFAVHPLGVVLDYSVNRPVYSVVSAFPGLFGFTAEDAGLHAQRPSLEGR